VSVNGSCDLFFRGGEAQNEANGEEHLAVLLWLLFELVLLSVTSGLRLLSDVGELTLSPERYP